MSESVYLSRDEHLQIVCGTGTGPAVWRDGQQQQDALAAQTRQLAAAIDELGHELRPALAATLGDLIGLIEAEYMYGPPANSWQPLVWGFCEALRGVSAALADPAQHAQDVIRLARDLLDSADDAEPDPLRQRTPWPQQLDERHRQDVRALLRDVVALPWATPRAAEAPLLVGLVTGSTRQVETWRELRMLPSIAQRERRPMLNALRLYLDTESRRDRDGATYCRYVVVTSGGRVPWHGDLRGRIERIQRQISRWAVVSRDEHAVHVVYRGTEMTLDDAGAHVHANIVVEPTHYMGERAWADYLAAMRRHFGVWCRDNGRVSDPKEIVKYVCKPTEQARHILGLVDQAERLARIEWLYRALYKVRLVAPLGAMRDLWRQIEADKLKPVVIGGKVRLTPKFTPPEKSNSPAQDQENVLVGHVLSNRIHTPWAEPSALVLGYTATPATAAGRRALERLEQMRADALLAWTANKAPAPATAVAIAQAWRGAATDQAARQVRALVNPGASGASAALSPARGSAGAVCHSMVHTSGVTVRRDFGPPDENSPGGVPPGLVWESGCLIDPQTGEIFDDRGRDAA